MTTPTSGGAGTPVRPGARAAALSLLVALTGALVVLAPAPALADATLTNPASITVPGVGQPPGNGPGSVYPSPITVEGQTSVVTRVTVRLNGVTHSHGTDLDVLLVGPQGQSVVLASDAGGNAPVGGTSPTFADDAAGPVPGQTSNVSGLGNGTYLPTNRASFDEPDVFPSPAPAGPYGTSLGAFNGTDANGTWRLFVNDDGEGDVGAITGGWTLTVETGASSFPGQLQLSRTEFRGTEGGGTAIVTVSRVNGDDGAVTARLATGSGSATPGADYTPVDQTVSFADGQTSATVTVPVTDDAAVEGADELVPLTLSAPTGGATLGSPTAGQLRIQDNDARANAFPVTVPSHGSASPYPSNIVVAGAGGVVTDVDVELDDVSHTFIRDLDVLLVAPNGATTLLMGDVGPGAGSPVSGLELTFDDEAAGGITQGPLTSGSYRPSRFEDDLADAFPAPAPAGPWGTTLAALDGTSPNGTWSLYVFDDANGDLGELGGWSLTLQTATASAGGPYSVPEGSPLTLSGSTTPSVTGATYAWDLDADGQYDDATGAAPTVAAATLQAIGLGDGPDSSNVRVRATAGSAVITSSATALSVTNVAPTATFGNDGPVTLGNAARVAFAGASDPSAADTAAGLRYAYDLDDDGVLDIGSGTYPGASTSATATVPAGLLDEVGTHVVRARVIDKDGGQTTYTTTVTVDPPPNVDPVADAGDDQVVNAGDQVALDGTASTDADEGTTLTYRWVQMSGPPVLITGAETAEPAFAAPEAGSTVVLELTVDDGEGGSDTDSVAVRVNEPPAADAGAARTVQQDADVTLDGTGSTDSDGDPLDHAWVQTAGPAVIVTGADTATPSFTAPGGPARLTFELTVTDPLGLTGTATVEITVNAAPTADAGPDRTVDEGDTVALDGTGSSDPEAGALDHEWVQTAGPAVALAGADTARPTFTALSGPATLTFELTVTDPDGGSDSDTVSVALNGALVADAGPDQEVVQGDAVTLDGEASSDPEDGDLDHRWAQTAGSAVTLADADTPTPSFTAPASGGTLTFELTVTDDRGRTDTDSVDVVVDRIPTADAGEDVVVGPASSVALDGTGSTDADDDDLGFAWAQTAGQPVVITGADTPVATFTAPTSGGTLTFELTVEDGRGGTDTDSVTVTVDGTGPTVALTSAAAELVNGPFPVTITFSEPVAGLTLDDLVATGATVADLTGSGDTYTVTVVPTADGPVGVRLPAGAVTDAVGNGSTVSGELTRTYDATRPTVDLSAASGPVGGPFEVDLTFSEDVTGLTLADLEVAGGTASGLTGADATYAVTITPADDGEVTVTAVDGAALDSAGNPSAASAPLARVADLTAPTVTLTTPSTDPTPSTSVPVTIAFSEDVTGLEVTDLTVTGGLLESLTGSGSTYTVTLTFDSPAAGATVGLPAGAAADAAGNPSEAAAPLSVGHDGAAPTVTVAVRPGQGSPVRAPVVSFVVTADEPVTDLDPADVAILGGTRAGRVGVERTGERSFDVLVSGMRRTAQVRVRLATGAVTDLVGNGSTAVESPSVAWALTGAPFLFVDLGHRCLADGGAELGLRVGPSAPTTFAVDSSNPALLPVSRIDLVGAGTPAPALRVRPWAAASGVAQVTVTATNARGTVRLGVRVVVGTHRADRLVGTGQTDVVLGRGGADHLLGRDHRDLLCGGAGDDVLEGGRGKDVLVGGPGDDRLVGGPGQNQLTPRQRRLGVG